MKSYRLKTRAKLGAEINIARLLQPPQMDQIHATDLRSVPVASYTDIPVEGKTEATVSSRRKEEKKELTVDYELTCALKTKDKRDKKCVWRGKCDDTSKFAVAFLEDNEVRLGLVDHWYKFTRIHTVSTPSTLKDTLETPLERTKRARDNDDSHSCSEEIDYEAEFEDDSDGEICVEDQGTSLTTSGQALQQTLKDRSEASISDSEDMGLESSSEEEGNGKSALSKDLFVREMKRLGKIEKTDLLRILIAKFELKTTESHRRLTEYISKYTEEFLEGDRTMYVLKSK